MPNNINGYVYLTDVGGTKIKPITDLAAINMTTSNGIEVMSAGGGTIGIVPGYIESKYYNNMISQGVGPATPQNTYVSGGTMYTLLGGYAISSEVPSINADPYKVPNEVAVRAAIDAYVATGGTDIVQGTGINVSGGSINMNIAGTDEVLTSTKTGTNTLDEDEAVTPANLRGALSIGQAVDVSCAPYNNTGTVTYSADGFLGGFTASMVAGTTIGYYNTGDQKFPKFAPNLKYLMIADVSGTGTVTPNGYDDVVLTETPQRIAMVVTAQDTGYISAEAAATLNVKNWRQYEVTALTPDAIQYLADYGTTPANNPVGLDPLFREANIYAAQNIRDKYLVKQDMVCPFIPVIGMSNSDLTIAAGLAYQMTITDDADHYFTADTIPTNGYGWDSHLQLFVNDLSKIHFQPPLNLVDPLTPNAAHNITVKWRAGQANVYVDDTDVGYIITVTSGSDEGSLAYGLTTSDSGYIIFSRTTDGTPVSATATTTLSRPVIVMGHGADTTSIAGSITVTTSATNSLLFTMLTVDNMTLNGNVSVTGVGFGTATISGGTVKAYGNNSVSGAVTVNGKLALDSNSVLDLSENSTNVPVTGTGTVSVPSGTAYVIPYGSSVAVPVTGASAGTSINKYGKVGYLVSDASATTASNTLYDALVGDGAVYSNICFDPALDGQTISGVTATVPTTHPFAMYGNGEANTILNDFRCVSESGTLYNCKFSNITFTGTQYKASISAEYANCTITSGIWSGYYPCAGAFSNCTITNMRLNNPAADGILCNSNVENTNLYVTGCTGGIITLGYYPTARIKDSRFINNSISSTTTNVFGLVHIISVINTTISAMENCYFKSTNISHNAAVDISTNSTVSISGCTFDSVYDGIRIVDSNSICTFAGTNILNSTVSGAGTIAFADGATVTSVIPDGSTIGTGVISALTKFDTADVTVNFENITITGITSTMSPFKPTVANVEMAFTNCVFSNNTISGGAYLLQTSFASHVLRLTGCTISAFPTYAACMYYNYNGTGYITNTDLSRFSIYVGTCVFSGKCTFDYFSPTGDNACAAKCVIVPGSTITAPSFGAMTGTGMYYVGNYNESTGAVTTTGTATAVVGGTTVSITGSGTTIDSTGLHS